MMHAICPVQSYRAADWAGWTIVSTERVQPRAGVLAHSADAGVRNRLFPSQEPSKGQGWDVHHLVKPRNGGSR
jgi:hypothetical protein